MALEPIPYVAVDTGESGDAPSGAIPISLYGVEGGGEAPVTSVNGATGAVVLDAEDVGALPDDYTPPAPTWASVTGKPSTFAPATHTHAAADIASGTLADARIPALAIAKITGLEARLTAIEGRLDALEEPAA